jgi:predicted nucleic acid-binding protein
LSYPEGCAALAAAKRNKRLAIKTHARARAEFESLHREMLVVGIDQQLAGHAGDLADTFDLCGYDAVHLATALELSTDITLVTWDADLRRAAAQAGCGIAPAG